MRPGIVLLAIVTSVITLICPPITGWAGENKLTRAGAVWLVVGALQCEGVRGSAPEFKDVGPDDPLYHVLADARCRGWIRGYPDGSFRPQAQISPAEAAVVLLRIAGSEEEGQGEGWEDRALAGARDLGCEEPERLAEENVFRQALGKAFLMSRSIPVTGRVRVRQGQVSITPGERLIKAGQEEEIGPDTAVEVLPGGEAEVFLGHDAYLLVKENSVLTVREILGRPVADEFGAWRRLCEGFRGELVKGEVISFACPIPGQWLDVGGLKFEWGVVRISAEGRHAFLIGMPYGGAQVAEAVLTGNSIGEPFRRSDWDALRGALSWLQSKLADAATPNDALRWAVQRLSSFTRSEDGRIGDAREGDPGASDTFPGEEGDAPSEEELVIRGVFPELAPPGATIVLCGEGFGEIPGEVYLGSVAAQVYSWRPGEISFLVPQIPPGEVTGAVYCGSRRAGFPFAVLPLPIITKLNPNAGVWRQKVELKGKFGTVEGEVYFGGVRASVVEWGEETVVAEVPMGVKSGPVSVVVAGVASENNPEFTVVPIYPMESYTPFRSNCSPFEGPTGEGLDLVVSFPGELQGGRDYGNVVAAGDGSLLAVTGEAVWRVFPDGGDEPERLLDVPADTTLVLTSQGNLWAVSPSECIYMSMSGEKTLCVAPLDNDTFVPAAVLSVGEGVYLISRTSDDSYYFVLVSPEEPKKPVWITNLGLQGEPVGLAWDGKETFFITFTSGCQWVVREDGQWKCSMPTITFNGSCSRPLYAGDGRFVFTIVQGQEEFKVWCIEVLRNGFEYMKCLRKKTSTLGPPAGYAGEVFVTVWEGVYRIDLEDDGNCPHAYLLDYGCSINIPPLIGADGNIYVTVDGGIVGVDSNGNQRFYGSLGEEEEIDTMFLVPEGLIAVTSKGNVYLSGQSP